MWDKAGYFVIFFMIGAIIGFQILTSRQNVTGSLVFDDNGFEMGALSSKSSELLFVEPSAVVNQRKDFAAKLRSAGNKRTLYEQYIDVIGPNGILDGIEKLWPKCHSEAHDLGKAIFAKVQDIGEGLRICADRCYSGCMHGVLMEAFSEAQNKNDSDGHVDVSALKPLMNDLCSKNPEMASSYSPGDCAHGVGHALMFLTGYDIPKAVNGCKEFDIPAMAYYCATGAYMEYVIEKDEEDATTKGLFYPCDTYDYPAACARYKMVQVARRYHKEKKTPEDIANECAKLDGKFRLGCFHGLGNAYMGLIASKMPIKDVCLHGTEDEKFVCIEGAMERMAKYHRLRALKVCTDLENKYKDICMTAVNYGMYNMSKNLTLYLAE